MTTWLRTGTPTFTDNSTTVTFTGVDLIASNVNAGDAIHAPDGEVYEIASVDSATQLTLTQPYRLRTGYAIQPTRGIVAKLRDALQAQISQVESYLSGPLIGRFNGGSAAQPGVSRNTDQDTGLAWLTSNALSVIAGGTEALRLTATEASGGAVQSTTTDATIGKLMKVGGFGIGGNAAGVPSANLDDITVSGAYPFDASTLNSPPSMTNGIVWHGTRTTGIHTQIAISRGNGSQGRIAGRSSTAQNSWTDWCTPYERRTILGTVSQSSGVPTGAIIERGSNANGSYTRWADGTQMCWNSNAAIATAPAAFSGTITKIDGNKLWIGRWF